MDSDFYTFYTLYKQHTGEYDNYSKEKFMGRAAVKKTDRAGETY